MSWGKTKKQYDTAEKLLSCAIFMLLLFNVENSYLFFMRTEYIVSFAAANQSQTAENVDFLYRLDDMIISRLNAPDSLKLET